MLRGAQAHTDRLRRMGRTGAGLGRTMYAAGQLIEIEAERSITEGSVSGKGHVPSAPGEAPNADSRFLDTHIETTLVSPTRVQVASNAPYSAHLEYGTSRMEERPFMRPALAKMRHKAQALIAAAVRRTIRGG